MLRLHCIVELNKATNISCIYFDHGGPYCICIYRLLELYCMSPPLFDLEIYKVKQLKCYFNKSIKISRCFLKIIKKVFTLILSLMLAVTH